MLWDVKVDFAAYRTAAELRIPYQTTLPAARHACISFYLTGVWSVPKLSISHRTCDLYKAPLLRHLEDFSFPNLLIILGNNFSIGTSTTGRLISESESSSLRQHDIQTSML